MKFLNVEVFLFLHLVEVGGHPDTAPHPPPAVPAPPASILYVSNSVAPDMDELTHNVLEWGGVFVPTSCRSQHSHGGSRMEWTWRTATESNVPYSPKSPSSVQEVFVKFLSLILWEMQSHQRRPMVMLLQEQPQLLQSLSLRRHCVLSKFLHQQASSHQACFFRTVTSF